ncbi:hypothetical protein DFP72DRAFT_1149210 [Ephemerocybe angulata]|uniref:DUF6533 domain-containing protein n=1 Tax=Ephemerocybe angulata TaxID=980116 RepID=A0A8H6M0M1_9AGAR|nr:hypothetical protein DFP72DRAFT_1149210 [Tulosesus angulatus]
MDSGLHTIYVYYYTTTLSEEVNIMWPQNWRTGKILYLFIRYVPLFFMATVLDLHEFVAGLPDNILASEAQPPTKSAMSPVVALLICLFALLNARRSYVGLLVAIYTALTLGDSIPSLRYGEYLSRALPLSQVERELGYSCTWAGVSSSDIVLANKKAGYVALAKAISLYIFSVRYRKQTGTLFETVRRDSGIYILSFVGLSALRLGTALAVTLRIENDLNLPGYAFSMYVPDSNRMVPGHSSPPSMFQTAIPVLACRLLVEIRKTEDPAVRTAISSILFDPPSPSENTEDSDYEPEINQVPREMVQFQGLGRRRAGEGGRAGRDEEAGAGENPIVD